VPEEEYTIPIGQADLKRSGSDITLVSWSKNVYLTLEVAKDLESQGISAEVLDLRTLRPLDTQALLSSVAKTHRCLIIQEQHLVASYGAYLSHLICDQIFDELDAPVKVVSALECPLPYSKALEEVVLPSKNRILHAVHELLEGGI
jgi:pyruvate dehydrogenase E1 component beta subunit